MFNLFCSNGRPIRVVSLCMHLDRRHEPCLQVQYIFLLVVMSLLVSTSALDCLESIVSEMTYYVSSWTLISAQSFILISYKLKIFATRTSVAVSIAPNFPYDVNTLLKIPVAVPAVFLRIF